MFFTGLLYLMFEDTIIRRSSSVSQSPSSVSSLGSRIIMGTQVGMVLLSLIVTRSSVSFLQARQGLPLGNRVVGWSVLGKFGNFIAVPLCYDRETLLNMEQVRRLCCHLSTVYTQTATICTASWSSS